jgi:hypothetical protein|tara:strand:- start:2051 stop:2434 length:384 start_codon:yes stop_codon:yes gene_type:complete
MSNLKEERLNRARNLSGAKKEPETSTLNEIIERIAALEIKNEFIEESKWDDHDLECPWEDICVRHGAMSEGAGAKDCPYPKGTHAAKRWYAGYSFSAYWRRLITDQMKDAARELSEIHHASNEWEDI